MSSDNEDSDRISLEAAEIIEEVSPPTNSARKQGRNKSSKNLENLINKVVQKCSRGERHCRACAKNMDHGNLPAYVKCLYCGTVHGFYRIRTGRHARERLYLEDHDGKHIPRYNADGEFVGNRWYYGEKMYYENGDAVPETKRITACSNDACKFYKIPIKEVEKYDRMTNGRLEKI